MEEINCLTNDPRQKFQLTVEGETLNVSLYFYQSQKSWFFDIEYGDYTCKGMRVVLTHNALRHIRNLIPFGIAFYADGEAEPYALNDFANKRVRMFILAKDEVAEIEEGYYKQ